jgi:hypothetical protein
LLHFGYRLPATRYRFLDDFFEDVRFLDRPLFFEDFFFDDFFEDFFDEVLVLPSAARSLFTVAAAIRFAVPVDLPCFFALDLMCSYCLSSLLLQAFGIGDPFP